MGMVISGRWSDQNRTVVNGFYNRPKSHFKNTGLSLNKRGGVASRRQILFVSLSCPWCHRLTIIHHIKKLEAQLPLHIAGEPRRQGYALNGGEEISIPGISEPVRHLHELYTATITGYTGRSTIPVLWDCDQGQIINNESTDLLHYLNDLPAAPDGLDTNLFPPEHKARIKAWNEILYDGLNNGVYEAGFAKSQVAYETAVRKVFETLDQLESHLTNRHFVVGNSLTATDCCLYPTLVRFDPVYHSHFKCSLRRIADYPNLQRYMRNLEQTLYLQTTVDMEVIRHAYFFNDRDINPTGIIPLPASDEPSSVHPS